MIHSIMLTHEEKQALKEHHINTFWRFVSATNSTALELNGKLCLEVNRHNIDLFCQQYCDDDVIDMQLINGRIYVAAKWLCALASDSEILALKPEQHTVN